MCVLPTMTKLRPAVKMWLEENGRQSKSGAADAKATGKKRAVVDRLLARFNIPELDKIIWPVYTKQVILSCCIFLGLIQSV